MDPNLLWIPIVLGWFALEFYGLHSSRDRAQPFTYWVRHIFDLRQGWHSIGWWITFGVIAWIAAHFLIASVGP
jgi:hypothetical protein